MDKTIRIQVTQEDIDGGIRHSIYDCPVARACSRILGKPFVFVSGADEGDVRDFGNTPRTYSYETGVSERIGRFDIGGGMEPFEFTMTRKD